jgi:hypothetical protein
MYQGNGVRKGWRDRKSDQNPNTITPVCRLHDANFFSCVTDIQNGWMQGRMRRSVQVFCHENGSTECGKLLRSKTHRERERERERGAEILPIFHINLSLSVLYMISLLTTTILPSCLTHRKFRGSEPRVICTPPYTNLRNNYHDPHGVIRCLKASV